VSVTDNSTPQGRPSDAELEEADRLFDQFDMRVRAVEPGERVYLRSPKFTDPVGADASGEVSSVPTIPTFSGQLTYGDFPNLAKALRNHMLTPTGIPWQDKIASFAGAEPGPRTQLVADIEALVANDAVSEEALRSWIHAHAAAPGGFLDPGVPVRQSLLELRLAVMAPPTDDDRLPQ
jgi:hypothetical protein